jgi:hypothetical protein
MATERTYQRRIQRLKKLVHDMQWVMPSYNGSPSCAGCGAQKHLGCEPWCRTAKITRDYGRADQKGGALC